MHCEDVADEVVVPCLGRGEGTEVVPSEQERRSPFERIDVDRPRPPEDASRVQSRASVSYPYAVAVRPGSRREAGVEVLRHLLDEKRRDVLGQRGGEGLRRACERRTALHGDARNLAGRVDAGVGAPGDREPVPTADRWFRGPRAGRLRPYAGPGWRAQPRNPVPSYSSVSFRFTT